MTVMRKDFGAKTYLYPLPVLIIGTYDEDGKANAMNVAWGGMCNSVPPCLAINIEKDRKTLENIQQKKAFTVSVADVAHVEEADYVGLVHGHNVDKFAAAGLHAEPAAHVDAPIITEFPMTLECKVVDMRDTGDSIRIAGEIVNVSADESVLDKEGKIDPDKLKPISFDPVNNTYRVLGEVVEKAFKPGLKFKK